MTQRTHDTGELVRVVADLAAEREPSISPDLIRGIIEAESTHFDNRAHARRRVEELVEAHLERQGL